MVKPPHILNAASNLLGIALIIIAGLNVTHVAAQTFADEVAWGSAICLSLSCLLSYAAMRSGDGRSDRLELLADRVFLAGLVTLFLSVIVLAIEHR